MTETKRIRLQAQVDSLTEANIQLTKLLICVARMKGGEIRLLESELCPPKDSKVDVSVDASQRQVVIKYIPPPVLVP